MNTPVSFEMTDKELKDTYLGKRIEVPYKYPIPNIGSGKETVAGICKNIGHNPSLPSWGIVVVIGRLPIPNVDPLKIKIL